MGNEPGGQVRELLGVKFTARLWVNPHFYMEVSPLTFSCTCALLQSVDPCSIDSIGEPE